MSAGTLIGIFLDQVERRRDATMFMRKRAGQWESIAASRAFGDVGSLALGLDALGVRSGDRVGLIAETRYEWMLTDLATLANGAVLVPVYPTLTAEQTQRVLAHSECRVLVIAGEATLAKMRSVRAQMPALQCVVCIDAAPQGDGERAFMDVIAAGAARHTAGADGLRARAQDVRPDDLATIIYTSGTTGEPKGAMLTHGNIASNVEACLEVAGLTGDDLALSFLPLCHVFERMSAYAMLRAGMTIAYAESMDTVAANLREVRPTIVTGVPRFYEKAHARVLERVQGMSVFQRRLFAWGLEQGRRRARAHFAGDDHTTLAMRLADRIVGGGVRRNMGGRLRLCVSGGAALNPETMEFFFAIGVPVIEGYGLTETSPVICLNPPGRERPGSVGRPVPGVEVRIGDQGEILTRGPHVMKGYFRAEEATREALRDGWFHTGDVGEIDAEGYLRITDRLKDLIVLAGGKKVAPQPIEVAFKRSELIAEAVLLGEGRPFVVCLVAPEFSALEAAARAGGWAGGSRADLVASPQVRELIAAEIERVNLGLAKFETVKGFAVLGEELTQENGALTPTLKVKRRVIVERYADVLRSLYAGH